MFYSILQNLPLFTSGFIFGVTSDYESPNRNYTENSKVGQKEGPIFETHQNLRGKSVVFVFWCYPTNQQHHTTKQQHQLHYHNH